MEPKTRTSEADIAAQATSAPDIPTGRALQARHLRDQGLTVKAVGQALGVGERQVRRLLASAPESAPTAATRAPDAASPPEAGQPRPTARKPAVVGQRRDSKGRLRERLPEPGQTGTILRPFFVDGGLSRRSEWEAVGDYELGPSYPVHDGQILTSSTVVTLPQRTAILDKHSEEEEARWLAEAEAEGFDGVEVRSRRDGRRLFTLERG